MFSEVIKLTPTVDRAGLNTMMQTLNQRFATVAQKFAGGLKNALKFGGIASVAVGLLSKILNPLEKAQELLDKILDKGDNAVTNAEEFQTTPGKLLRLEALGKAKGLDPDTLRQLLGKFQGALAKEQEAAAAPARLQQKLAVETDPSKRGLLQQQIAVAEEEKAKGGVLHEFIGEKDTADAFFKFIQSLQKLDKPQQTVVQSEIFGERVRGKASEFFNATDFAEILAKLPSNEVLSKAAEKTNKVSDLKDLLTAIRESKDFVTKSGLVNDAQVIAVDQGQGIKDTADNETLKRFLTIKNTSESIDRLTAKFDKFVTQMTETFLPELVKGIEAISKFVPSVPEVKESIDSVIQKAANATVAIQDSAIMQWIDQKDAEASQTKYEILNRIEQIWSEVKAAIKFW